MPDTKTSALNQISTLADGDGFVALDTSESELREVLASVVYEYIATRGASTASSGAVTFQPASGSEFAVDCAAGGDVAFNTDDLYIDTSTSFVGVGTASPGYPLDTNFSGSGTTWTISADATYEGIAAVRNSSGKGVITGGNGTHGFLATTANNADLVMATRSGGSNTEGLRVTATGPNVCINTTSGGSSSVGVLAIGNGTAPTGSITNGVQLYSEDVSSSAELKVRDEAGNVTTLSPHPHDAPDHLYFFGPGRDSFHATQNHMAKMIQWVNLSKFFFDGDAAKDDCTAMESFDEYNVRRSLSAGDPGFLAVE